EGMVRRDGPDERENEADADCKTADVHKMLRLRSCTPKPRGAQDLTREAPTRESRPCRAPPRRRYSVDRCPPDRRMEGDIRAAPAAGRTGAEMSACRWQHARTWAATKSASGTRSCRGSSTRPF